MSNKNIALSSKQRDTGLSQRLLRRDSAEPRRRGEVIFCDFDGTITLEDVVDGLLGLYADDRWREIEKLWERGKIGSEECLRLQLGCIGSLEERELLRFASGVEIDPGFRDFIDTASRNGVELYIVSDGFDFLIKLILLKNGISAIPVFANGLRVRNSKPVPSFPFRSGECRMKSGMCKCSIIDKYKGRNAVTYIGDGESDVCAVRKADTVFAKDRLSTHCERSGIRFTGFTSFADIKTILFEKEKKNVERQ